MKSRVLVLKETGSSIDSSIQKIFDFYPHIVEKKPKKIAIKLNICTIKPPESGSISHPQVVESLLKFLRQKCGSEPDISLIEADATYNRNVDVCYKVLGYEKIAQRYAVKCVNLSNAPAVKRKINGGLFREITVPRIIVESDLLITLPKLKTHFTTKITCGLKNQFGAYQTKNKYKLHKKLDAAIVDANLIRKPDFALIDGIIGAEGPGTICGFTKRYNLLVASDDVVAADCVCAKILGFNPYFVGHVRKAAAKGIGSFRYSVHGSELKTVLAKADFDKFAYYYTEFGRTMDNFVSHFGV